MAAQRKATDTGAETVTTPLESDVADANTDAVAAAETVPAGDPRDEALAQFLGKTVGSLEVITADTELVVDESEVLDFGGRTKAVVIISYYNQFVDGLVRQAKKGQVIKTDAESLARGERIGSLKKYGE